VGADGPHWPIAITACIDARTLWMIMQWVMYIFIYMNIYIYIYIYVYISVYILL